MSDRILYQYCPLCNSDDTHNLLRGDCSMHTMYDSNLSPEIQWMECRNCSHIHTSGYYKKEALDIIFSKAQINQILGGPIEQNRIISSRMVEKVLPFAADGNWLDVGPGNGSLLFTAQEYGFTPIGIDLRAENVRILNALNIESYCVDLSDLKLMQHCSVVSMADVLEHMPFPKNGLAATNKLLRTGGILFISMPNTENIVWDLMNRQNCNPYWGELEHYHNFSRTRLYQLLYEHGFQVMRYGISERYRVCMEVVALKISDLH